MKYYYTDVLAAAWMAKHFGMKLQKGVFGYGEGVTTYLTLLDAAGNEAWKYRYYIHPDSLPLLEPKEGDVVRLNNSIRPRFNICDDKGKLLLDRKKNPITTTKFPYHEYIVFNEHFREDVMAIIQRNGIPFMWPEREGE